MDQNDERGPINLGNPQEITIIELAEAVLRLVGGRSKIVYRPKPEDDPCRRKPDISKARAQLGWEPTVDLEDGLNETIDYFRRKLG
jgi:UDP-glucuronate decarboxylase